MTLDPTPAANLPSSDVPGWIVVAALALLAFTMLAARRMAYPCHDPRCPICRPTPTTPTVPTQRDRRGEVRQAAAIRHAVVGWADLIDWETELTEGGQR